MNRCMVCLVHGKVQGVWYRATIQERAEALGVTGRARNLPDGRVEVLACGDDVGLTELREWLWEGSPAAHVDSVECEDSEEPPPKDFRTG
ncbi:MAG TPA: acylphosphatase [Gammaproteobacteria bacterium]|nr:acylphosphatase [Gammaproteobacteria bacterium]